MPYELILELARPLPRRTVTDALDATPDARRFAAEPRGRTWLGKVKSLALVLPFGGAREEAAAFGRVAGELARRLGAALLDPQLGHGLPPGAESAWVVDTWSEANLRALAGYERGWVVRPAARLGDDGRALPVEAVRTDAVAAGALSVARAYLRAGAAERARAVAEQVLDVVDGASAEERDEARALLRQAERHEAIFGAGGAGGDAGRAAVTRPSHGPGDAPALLEALRDEATRDRAAAALAALGPPAFEPLLAALADEDLRPGVAVALEEVGAPVLPALARRLARGTRPEVEGALDVLDDLFAVTGADAAVVEAAVARLLAEPDLEAPGLGLALERACASSPQATRAAVRLLREGAARHAGAAADALGAQGPRAGADAAQALVARLLGAPEPDLDDDALARALRAVAPARGGELAAALDREPDPERRARLLHALVEVDAGLAAPRLIAAVRSAAARDPADVRPDCADDADFVLATWVRDPAALPALLAAVDDPLPAVRLALVGAFAAIDDADARAALARLASDPHPEVRQAAQGALT